MERCRICLETDPLSALYCMPCTCRGVVHTECFGVWMSTGGKMGCEVCLTQFGRIMTPQDLNYLFLLYHVTFGLFYYFCFALAASVYWITNSPFPSVHQRFSDVSVFLTIIMCLHPVLVTLAYVAVTVQRCICHPFATGTDVATYTTFLQRHGSKV